MAIQENLEGWGKNKLNWPFKSKPLLLVQPKSSEYLEKPFVEIKPGDKAKSERKRLKIITNDGRH